MWTIQKQDVSIVRKVGDEEKTPKDVEQIEFLELVSKFHCPLQESSIFRTPRNPANCFGGFYWYK